MAEKLDNKNSPPKKTFLTEVEDLINRCGLEKGSNTPDYILAEYLGICLAALDKFAEKRDKWYGTDKNPIPMTYPPEYSEEINPLLRFYDAETLPELIRAMEAHIARLQDRVTQLTNPDVMIMRVPREG